MYIVVSGLNSPILSPKEERNLGEARNGRATKPTIQYSRFRRPQSKHTIRNTDFLFIIAPKARWPAAWFDCAAASLTSHHPSSIVVRCCCWPGCALAMTHIWDLIFFLARPSIQQQPQKRGENVQSAFFDCPDLGPGR